MASSSPTQPPSNDSVAHIYSPEYYARLAEMEERHWWSMGVRAIATRMLDHYAPPARNWCALDAGCGTGFTLTWLRRYADIEPIGFDLARVGLEFCARRHHRQLAEASTLAIPFATDHFDLVVSMDVLQHLPRPGGDRHALIEIARVLKRDGLFLLRTNSHCGFPPTQAADYHRYSVSEVSALLTETGFRIEAVSYVNFLPGLLATARQIITQPNGRNRDLGLTMIPRPPETNVFTRIMYRSLLAEGAYLAPGQRALPFGHSILALGRKVS